MTKKLVLERVQYSLEELNQIAAHYDLTPKQIRKFLTSWNDIWANLNCPYLDYRWDDPLSKRPMSRDFYEHLLTRPSGYMTKAALDIIYDSLLDKKEKAKLTTADHVLSGQTYGTYVIANYVELFQDNLFNYVKECLTASQTVVCTNEENEKFKTFTVNDETTSDTLRLKVPTSERYKAAGVEKLWDIKSGRYIDYFPFELSDEFLEYEENELLL